MAVALGFIAIALGALGCLRANGARRHTRRLQATLEEMIALMEMLSERYPAGGLEPPGETVAEPCAPAAEALSAEPAPGDMGTGVRGRVAQLDASGASRSAICRETRLSQGEVKLILALNQRMGVVA